jgi:hypothetical protein
MKSSQPIDYAEFMKLVKVSGLSAPPRRQKKSAFSLSQKMECGNPPLLRA